MVLAEIQEQPTIRMDPLVVLAELEAEPTTLGHHLLAVMVERVPDGVVWEAAAQVMETAVALDKPEA